MRIIRTLTDLEQSVADWRRKGLRLGLVPTMGALHDGHLSLVSRAREENDVVLVSIFVNPVQFNNPRDLATYPRDEENDFRLLAREKADAVFAPSVEEIYPDGLESNEVFELGEAAEVMEGPRRPGHFQGVARIVNRLFQLTQPTNAYFGEKDFQQVAVIRNLVLSRKLDVNIVSCPIKRADDGLALSSRNLLLTPEQRRTAPAIHRILSQSVEDSRSQGVEETRRKVVDEINATEGLEVEYFEIVDGRTLRSVEQWTESDWVVGCITVHCGQVRLIDNIAYRLPSE